MTTFTADAERRAALAAAVAEGVKGHGEPGEPIRGGDQRLLETSSNQLTAASPHRPGNKEKRRAGVCFPNAGWMSGRTGRRERA